MQPNALLYAMASVLRDRHAHAAITANAAGYLARGGLSGADLRALSEGAAPSRLLVYRRLVHARFRDAIEVALPRTAARRGAAGFEADVTDFMHDRASASSYVRDIAREFVAWAETAWPKVSLVPDYLIDLARHELLRIEVSAAPDDVPEPLVQELSLSSHLVFQRAATIVRYENAVHLLPEERADGSVPERRETALLAYRGPDYQVRYLELSKVAGHIMTLLLIEGATLSDAIVLGCTRAATPMDDTVLGGTLAVLTDLAERGVLLGAGPPP